MFYRHDETFQNSAAPGLLPNKMLTTAIVPSTITDIIIFYCTFSQFDNKRKIIGEGKRTIFQCEKLLHDISVYLLKETLKASVHIITILERYQCCRSYLIM